MKKPRKPKVEGSVLNLPKWEMSEQGYITGGPKTFLYGDFDETPLFVEAAKEFNDRKNGDIGDN